MKEFRFPSVGCKFIKSANRRAAINIVLFNKRGRHSGRLAKVLKSIAANQCLRITRNFKSEPISALKIEGNSRVRSLPPVCYLGSNREAHHDILGSGAAYAMPVCRYAGMPGKYTYLKGPLPQGGGKSRTRYYIISTVISVSFCSYFYLCGKVTIFIFNP